MTFTASPPSGAQRPPITTSSPSAKARTPDMTRGKRIVSGDGTRPRSAAETTGSARARPPDLGESAAAPSPAHASPAVGRRPPALTGATVTTV